jgi:hypothetical protein
MILGTMKMKIRETLIDLKSAFIEHDVKSGMQSVLAASTAISVFIQFRHAISFQNQ